MNRITITAGVGETAAGLPIEPARLAEALATIRGTLAERFGGYTETDTYGGWIDPAGELVTEPGKRWVVLGAGSDEAADDAADMVRVALQQASVMLEVEPVAARFVNAREVA